MDWTAQFDSYCERVDFTFWSEPVNAITNLAFILAALIVLPGARRDMGEMLLVATLFVIGTGSFLFHTFATGWASMLDVLPILLFILTYIYLASRRFLHLTRWVSGLIVLAYIPYSAALGWIITQIAGPLNGSVSYMPVVVLIAAYAILTAKPHPRTAKGLAIGAGILAVSLFFRTIDEAVCPGFPLGTHFLWHILNAIMLAHMIRLLPHHRHGAS